MKKKLVKNIIHVFFAVMSFISLLTTDEVYILLSKSVGPGDLKWVVLNNIFTNTAEKTVLLILIVYLFVKLMSICPKLKKHQLLFCLFVGVIMWIGKSCATVGTVFIFKWWFQIFEAIYIVGISVTTAIIVILVQAGLNKINIRKVPCLDATKNHRLFFISALTMFILWQPYILIRYPGAMEYDAFFQINQFLGVIPMTSHWPPFSSAFMGFFVLIGQKFFNSNNIGLFMLVVFQSTCCIAVFSYSIVLLHKLGANKIIVVSTLILYSIVPIFPAYSSSVVKDTMYSISVLLLILTLTEIILIGTNKINLIFLFLSAIMTTLFRNNGLYVLLFIIILLSIYAIRNKHKWATKVIGILLASCGFFMIYSNILLPSLDIPKGSIAEALSIPFQQTARYVSLYQSEITTEEAESIQNVLDFENLASSYDPDLSDPVKNSYHGNSDTLRNYLKTWFKMFFKHPTVYIDATLNNTYGFFYPNVKQIFLTSMPYSSTIYVDGMTVFNSPDSLSAFRVILNNYATTWDYSPILFLFCNTGINIMVLIYLLLKDISEKKSKYVIILGASIIGMLICIASPTWWKNGFRYALPIIFANPFLIALHINNLKNSHQK